MAKKKLSAKQRELRRVRQLISRAEKRGYRWVPEFKEELSSLSWQKLRTYTPEKLYQKATALSETGKVIAGTERRKEERSQASLKAAETVRTRKFYETPEGKELQRQQQRETLEYQLFEQERRLRDSRDLALAQEFARGEMLYNQLDTLILSQPGQGSQYLSNLLKSEVSRYGQNAVNMALANLDYDTIYRAEQVAYYEGTKGEMHSALVNLADAIKGTIATLSERKELGDIMDSMTDFSEL